MWIADADPILIAAAQQPFDRSAPVAVAVSGGGDSMALLHLLVQSGLRLSAVTVDHGLRDAARDEAALVARFCARHDIAHEILRWNGRGAMGNLMNQARRARYGLIADWAIARGIGQVALAHQADDVAETFLMRLTRRAGVDGLAAMAPSFIWNGVHFHRPLLRHSRKELHDHLARHAIACVDDPSNSDPDRERARVRAAGETLARIGLTGGILRDVAENLGQARAALRFSAHHFARAAVTQQGGDLTLELSAFAPLPQEIQRRILVAAQVWINGADYSQRRGKQTTFMNAVLDGRTTTLAGCMLLAKGATRRLTREFAAVADLTTRSDAVWDCRWRMDGPHEPDLRIAALGPQGLPRCPDWRAQPLPRPSLLSSPAIWRGDTLIAAPMAGVANGWTATLEKERDDFAAFLLSH